ncbi:MAG: aminopeptidase P family protein [Bacteroidaceae bacterium]|nr:aminopeptidase P family protein [Bacteroidaceae bacterium]
MSKAEIIVQRIASLRQWMTERHLDAYIFPSTDPHSGEYVPDHWKAREWISGFNGSAGTIVVTLNRAALWTDSRYWLAAEEQTQGTSIEVVRCGRNQVTAEDVAAWLAQAQGEPAEGVMTLGCNAWTMPSDYAEDLAAALSRRGWQLKGSIHFKAQLNGAAMDVEINNDDPESALWTERPPLPNSLIEIQPLEYAGVPAADKLNAIRSSLADADSILITQLDEIAWTLNLRGQDVHCTPVFVSYLVVQPTDAVLYVNASQLTPEVEAYLQELKVMVRPYEDIARDLYSGAIDDSLGLQYDPSVTNMALRMAARQDGDSRFFYEYPSPVPSLRAVKNEAEIAGYRRAMLRDGVAMVKFLRWLKPAVEQGGVTEVGVDQKLTALRAEQDGFRDISFDTIAGYGPHAAVVHYEATPETDIPLEPKGLLLLDSGAQYQDGTTDITRTIALGPLTEQERRDYTLVLKGHIRLATAVFPEGTSGTQLDVLARYAMWQDHKNFGHGTGHGVGSYLSVHEGPHQFRMNWMPAPLKAGMTITIEPGIYIAGSHGARTENTMLIVEDGDRPTNEYGRWLRLEPLTLCPIDTTPIVRELMAADEIEYLNKYHARVREVLLPLLADEEDRAWLIQATKSF